MKTFVIAAGLALLCGCATPWHYSALRVVRQADAALAEETTATGFERRLAHLGAKIEGASSQRVATFLTPSSPSYFPPRQVRVVYSVTADGNVRLESATILSLVIVDHQRA
jgi:hypothetical protein